MGDSGDRPHEMFLLGAGASVDAGVPDSYAMTQRLLELVGSDPLHHRNAHLLRFVIGGLMFQEGIRGADPYGGVNVEDLFNAVQLLGERNTLEAAPFVGTWHSMVEEFDRVRPSRTDAKALQRRLGEQTAEAILKTLPSRPSSSDTRKLDQAFDKRLKKALDAAQKGRRVSFSPSESMGHEIADHVLGALKDTFSKLKNKSRTSSGDNQLNKALGDAVDQRRPRPAGGRLFRATNTLMIERLVHLVWIEDSERVAYLAPILNVLDSQPSLTVATLNYDNGIELLCEKHGVPCTTGIEAWSSEGAFPAPAEGVNLLKLHGSIDWRIVGGGPTAERPLPHTQIQRVESPPAEGSRARPALIFGQRNKLTAKGPFLDLLRSFRERLSTADRLTVIGYSFRDPHINEYLTRWINGDDKRRLRVIDPGFTTNPAPYAYMLPDHIPNRLDVIDEPAGVGLVHAFA